MWVNDRRVFIHRVVSGGCRERPLWPSAKKAFNHRVVSGGCRERFNNESTHSMRGVRRLQGAALVAVRQQMHIKILRTAPNPT